MDFFTVVPDPASHPSNPRVHPDAPSVDSFAEAIASRFGQGAILTTRLTPGPAPAPHPIVRLPSSPMASMTLAPLPPALPAQTTPPHSSAPHNFITLTPASLPQWLDDPATLVVDIRPHAAHSSARIPHAVSLSVPSTLLKRPLFSLQRLSAMLPSASARNRFAAWKSASRIVVYDADSSAIPDSSNIQGLLKKFKSDGFQGELAWLQGGFQAVWRERRDLVDTHPPTPDAEVDEEDEEHDKLSPQPAVLRTRHLPMAAFSSSSTTAYNSPHLNPITASQLPKLPSSANSNRSAPYNPSLLSLSTPSHHPAINPFFDTIRQNVELSHGITERIPLRLPRRVRRRINDLPFPWLQHIAKRAAKSPLLQHRPIDSCSSASEESEDDDGADPADVEEGSEALAMQFYRIELAEQRRLMGIMEHHSKESGFAASNSANPHQSAVMFPFSITAGVEKGAKNRYRHIWPFEHARVRLHQKREADDDYVNASYVQPLGTKKRYIATQGPLPATFADFWTLCWEQNVYVIVMLTREIEGSMVKCGNYWADSNFGPLRLRLISTTGIVPPPEEPSFGGFFGHKPPLSSHSSRPHTGRLSQDRSYPDRHRWVHHHHQSETIKRVFELTHTAYPDAKPRRIVHLQYLDWPDMNVPDDPRGILSLIREVDQAVKETGSPSEPAPAGVKPKIGAVEIDEKTGIAKHAMGKNSPVLLHCSAGVGRTGGFIAIDAVLDAIRREVRKSKSESRQPEAKGDAMDVDVATPFRTTEGDTPAETAAIAMSAGVVQTDSAGGKKHAGPELTVHVPVISPTPVRDALRTPMQVDGVELPWIDRQPLSSTHVDATRQWAENVSKQTQSEGQSSKYEGAVATSSSSPDSASTSDSSNGECSTFGFKNSGSYRHPSSSLGTSVSVSSPPSSKGSPFPSAHLGRATSSVPNVLPPGRSFVEVHPTAAAAAAGDQRARTFSAPADPTLRRPKLPSASLVAKPSSDDELPSRSQSPSADESQSILSHSVPPAGVDSTTYRSTFSFAPPSSPIPGSQLTSEDVSSHSESSKAFDYKEPRPLHNDQEPSSLTTYEEPIWEVVQDMREQRMSLCQSLRQYVFVHAAIIEGALMVVDEENSTNDYAKASYSGTADTTSSRNFSFGYPKSSLYTTPSRSTTHLAYQTDASDSASSYSCTKRAASPTELLKEGKGGEPLQPKRPSVKRKHRSVDEPEDQSRSPPFQRAQVQLTVGGGSRRSPSHPR